MDYKTWFNSQLDAIGSWHWNETGVDVVLEDPHCHEDVKIKRIVDFFNTIDAPHLKRGNVVKLYEYGYQTIEDIISLPEDRIVGVIGENGKKIYKGLHDRLSNIEPYVLIGAYATERGIGVRKMKKLHQALGTNDLILCNDPSIIAQQDGFDKKTAEYVVKSLSDFREFFNKISPYVQFTEEQTKNQQTLFNEKIVLTGFRDKELQHRIEKAGGTVQTSVSSKTTIVVAADPNSSSSKMKKARDLGIKILDIEQFNQLLQ